NDKLSDGTEITDPSTQVTIDLDPSTPGVQNTLVVPNQGTWTVDPATGILTFNPEDGFTQTPTDVVYTLTETSTGLTDTATVKAGYDEADPIATDDSSTGNTPGDDATVKLLDNDTLSDGTPITDPSTQVTIDLDPTTAGVQNTLVVPNEGTWTVDPATGILTFNPEDGFTQTPTDVVYTLTETSTGLTDTATVKAGYTEVDPIATDDTSTGNTPGDDATIDVLDNDKLSDGTEITDPSTQVTIDLDPTIPGVQNTLVVPNEGTWTVDPATGILTFNPEDGFTQTPTDVVYTLTETSTGLSDTATVKAGYDEADPIATDDTSTGNTPGDDATVNLLDNDKLSDGSPITDPSTQVTIDLDSTTPGVQNTLVVPNQGTWTVDPATGILTFNPIDGFTQTPTDIIYELTETSTGLIDTATVKAGYTEVDPIATDDSSTGNTPGDDATVKLLDNDKLSDGTEITDPSTQVTIDLDPTTAGVQNTLVVPNEGTWTVDPATGILTFNPEDGFTQTPTDVVYTLTETSTGLTDTATVKAGYDEADPIATDDSSTGNTPGDDATIDVLDNDKLSDGTEITDPSTQVTIDLDPTIPGVQNTLVVPNEGTWTVDPATGILTFNPEDGFTQTPTDVVYTLTETSTGLSDTATVKAGYDEADPIATDDTSTGNTPGDDATVNLLDNDKLSDGTEITDPSTQVTIDLDPTTPGVQNTLVVPNQGTWTVDPATGILTFNPEDGFTQTPTDIIYELTETSTGLIDTATVKAGYDEGNPIATDDTSTGNTPGDDATVKLLDNDKLSDGTEITDPSTQVTIDLDPTTPGVQNTLVVPNEGTWTVDPATGILTFNPEDGFTQTPTDISYELTETSTGLSDIATVKAGYDEGNPIATDDSSTGNTPGDDATVKLLDNDTLSDGTPITDPSTQVTIDLDPTTAGVQNTLVVPNEGTWTVDPATGILTF
ncbi:beta strand repeat-containing protein, partial [Tenacibaculum finnmarkense]|uniref:beta strand repeat-containing protein n=1 Tax=Tenacibaculum finnmarkense TaxID=2781243 RepID=UPI00187B688A